ncbi:EAL domain-containing protein [Cupriavidus sp. D39]|uniref:EAL domain-containing protein n=1 Tax=Cupriavidus sp. D39 TaxID=2997877 RepID=UPI003B63FF9D
MEVVAEGTETQKHVTHLKSLGCDFGQGYFFSKPLESVALSALLEAQVPQNTQATLDIDACDASAAN